MATSVPCEQLLFSVAGLTITKSRNRLIGKSARALLCYRNNIIIYIIKIVK